MKAELRRWARGGAALAACWLTLGCSRADDEAERALVQQQMKAWLTSHLRELRLAAEELQRAAPLPAGRGWSASEDANQLRAMKQAWGRARAAYERVEGALAPLFPESDTATDARYDDFLATLGAAGDPAPFDDRGVIGVHAIERILWADAIPTATREFEQALPGYRPAAFPASEAEARQFKELLAARLVSDVKQLERDLEPLSLDIAFAYRGLLDLTAEQFEKVDRAATGREESRYAQTTLRDLRANREGCWEAYKIFAPWLLARGERGLDADVQGAFSRLKSAYDAIAGDSIPRPPAGWSSLTPKPEHASTEFGTLFSIVQRETDDRRAGSLSANLVRVAEALSLPKAVLR